MEDKTLSLNGAIDFVFNHKPKIKFKEEKDLTFYEKQLLEKLKEHIDDKFNEIEKELQNER